MVFSLPGIIVTFPRRDVFSSWSSPVRTCKCTACSLQTIPNAVQGALPGQPDLPGRWILCGGAVHDSRRLRRTMTRACSCRTRLHSALHFHETGRLLTATED
jgi:hypothetical protein